MLLDKKSLIKNGIKMENLQELSEKEMSQIEGGSLIGFLIGFAGAALEKASKVIADHPVGGSRNYQI